MGIFSFLKKPAPQNALSTSKSFFWGGSTSGTIVNEKTAMQTAAVYACVRVISEALASLPLNIYRYQSNGVQIIRDGAGRVTTLYPLLPAKVDVFRFFGQRILFRTKLQYAIQCALVVS